MYDAGRGVGVMVWSRAAGRQYMLFSNEICAINKDDVTEVFYMDKQ